MGSEGAGQVCVMILDGFDRLRVCGACCDNDRAVVCDINGRSATSSRRVKSSRPRFTSTRPVQAQLADGRRTTPGRPVAGRPYI
jgi:hypothetical protein